MFDHAHLSHYTMDNPRLEHEIMELFLDQLPVLLKQLVKTRSGEDWKFATHTLKGSSSAIGACKINAVARKMEVPGVFRQPEQRKKLLSELQIAAREFELLAQRLYPR